MHHQALGPKVTFNLPDADATDSGTMERMTGSDAMLLYLERLDSAHTLKVCVLDISAMERTIGFDDLRLAFAARLSRYPRFTQKLVHAPGDLDHPWWVLDESFRLDDHLDVRGIDPPGDRAAMDAVLSDLAAAPMPKDRPLWDATLLCGLAGDRVAVVTRLHHCITDGVGAVNALMAFTSPEPDGKGSAPVVSVEPGQPTRRQMLLGGTGHRVGSVRHIPGSLRQGVRARRARRELARSEPRVRSARIIGPDTSLNPRSIDSTRHCASGTWEFERIRSVAKHHAATVNHVLLTMVAEACRRELIRRHEPVPDVFMTAFGVASDTDIDRLWGNRITPANLPMHVHVADPVERLGVVRDTARPLIEIIRRETLPTAGRLAEFAHPLAGRALVAIVNRSPKVFANIVTANVAGPPRERWVGRARIVEWLSVAILQGSSGPNVTMYSYDGAVSVGVLTAGFHPEPARFVADMSSGLEMLESSVP